MSTPNLKTAVGSACVRDRHAAVELDVLVDPLDGGRVAVEQPLGVRGEVRDGIAVLEAHDLHRAGAVAADDLEHGLARAERVERHVRLGLP